MTEAEMDQMDQNIDDEIEAAKAFADASPYPAPGDVAKDVYTDIVEEVRVR